MANKKSIAPAPNSGSAGDFRPIVDGTNRGSYQDSPTDAVMIPFWRQLGPGAILRGMEESNQHRPQPTLADMPIGDARHVAGDWHGINGVSLSHQIKRADALGMRVWHNTAFGASDAVLVATVDALRQTRRRALVTGPNEVWNQGLPAHLHLYEQGVQLGYTEHPHLCVLADITKRLAELAAGAVDVVIEHQFNRPDTAQFLIDRVGDAATHFAVGVYAGHELRHVVDFPAGLVGSAEFEAYLEAILIEQIDYEIVPRMERYAELVDGRYVLVSYEGGIHLVAADDALRVPYCDFNRSKAAGRVTAYLWRKAKAAGLEIALPYSDVGLFEDEWADPKVKNQCFGHLERIGRNGVRVLPKWQALLGEEF